MQCENEKIKVFDSFVIKINMPIIEHLMYQKKMVLWLMVN